MRIRQRNSRVIAGLLLLVVVGGLVPFVAGQGDKLGLLRIIKADYPAQVPLSYTFTVKLKIEYAFRDYFEIHAAIYDGPRGTLDHLLWEGKPERLIEVGQRTYDAKLRSPSYQDRWVLTGYVFFRNDSGTYYFTDQERGPGFIEMTIKIADSAKLTIRTPYGNIPVQMDGSSYSTDVTGVLVHEVNVLSEHTITAPENVAVAEGWRALFYSWNGTDLANPKTILVTTDLILTIEFRDEFYLDVVSNVDDVRGAGWYPSGAVANISAPPLAKSNTWEGIFGVQWRFTSWSGDLESVAHNESIVMDRPHRVVANWTPDYGQVFYLIVAAAALAVIVGLAILVRRRMPKRSSEEPVAGSVRTFCMFCGSNIDRDARFCSKCGRSQVSSD